jgi:hypothetical protein
MSPTVDGRSTRSYRNRYAYQLNNTSAISSSVKPTVSCEMNGVLLGAERNALRISHHSTVGGRTMDVISPSDNGDFDLESQVGLHDQNNTIFVDIFLL